MTYYLRETLHQEVIQNILVQQGWTTNLHMIIVRIPEAAYRRGIDDAGN
jgi:hypothetical protein